VTSSDSSPSPGTSDPPSERELATLRAGLCLLARRELGDADLAEDVAQETLARTLAAWAEGRIRDTARLGAFARGVARHLIADAHRARRRVAAGELEASAAGVVAERPDALQDLVTREEAAAVRAALAALSPADRELLALLYVDGLRSEEIAARLGEPGARVRKRKERALERLRGLFHRGAVGLSHRSPHSD